MIEPRRKNEAMREMLRLVPPVPTRTRWKRVADWWREFAEVMLGRRAR